MKLVRIVLGYFVLIVEKLFAPKRPNRSQREQEQVDALSSTMSLYEFRTCPFCMKVRWALRRLGVKIPLKDAQKNLEHRNELLKRGGKIKVPCLRVEGQGGSTLR